MENKKKILSTKQWIEILQNENITTENSYNILITVYEFEDQQGYASERNAHGHWNAFDFMLTCLLNRQTHEVNMKTPKSQLLITYIF